MPKKRIIPLHQAQELLVPALPEVVLSERWILRHNKQLKMLKNENMRQKKQKKIEEARNSLQRGDKVVTIGGIHGKIVDVKDRTFTIEIARDVRIEVDKAAISFNEAELNSKPESKKEEKKEEEKSEDNE